MNNFLTKIKYSLLFTLLAKFVFSKNTNKLKNGSNNKSKIKKKIKKPKKKELIIKKNNNQNIDKDSNNFDTLKKIQIFNPKIIKQPGDGNCLFHSLAYGIGNISQIQIKQKIINWIKNNEDYNISGTPLKNWIMWETNLNIDNYCKRLENGMWGGAIEILICSQIENINIYVFEKKIGYFKNISSFEVEEPKKNIALLYYGNVHYDYLDGLIKY